MVFVFFPSWLLLWAQAEQGQSSPGAERDTDTPHFRAQNDTSSGQRSHPAVSCRMTPFPWIHRNLALPVPCSSTEQHLGLVTSSSDEPQLIFHLLPPPARRSEPVTLTGGCSPHMFYSFSVLCSSPSTCNTFQQGRAQRGCFGLTLSPCLDDGAAFYPCTPSQERCLQSSTLEHSRLPKAQG